MTNEEDKQFLLLQRQEGRVGGMVGIDKHLTGQEQRKRKRADRIEEMRQQNISKMHILEPAGESVGSSSTDNASPEHQVESFAESLAALHESQPGPSTSFESSSQRSRHQIITPRLVSVLDKCKISDRDAVHLLTATADAFGKSINEFVINRSSIRRYREKIREERALQIKEEFKGNDLKAAVIHWDGKLLPSVTGKEMVDRLPIIITSGDLEQILKVPFLESGTGRSQAEAIFQVLIEWGLQNVIQACCFDTTASNTGVFNGACVILEQLLERELLYLACRHHIFEIVIRAVFECKIPGTSGPNVPLFKRFQEAWPTIDKKKFASGLLETKVKNVFQSDREEIILYLKNTLQLKQTRDDYKEFLELCVIFLDGNSENVSFRYPGAMHHARWMSKVLYTLKMFLFRNEFRLKASEKKNLLDVCIFIVKIYVKVWFNAPKATKAPNSDFNLLRQLQEYKNIDTKIAETALKKFCHHLWYLTPEAVAFSLFDNDVSHAVKEKMRQKLLLYQQQEHYEEEEEDETSSKRLMVKSADTEKLLENDLDQFVQRSTLKFFERFELDQQFLSVAASEWETQDSYHQGLQIVSKIKVVNDTAERGVKLIEQYNEKLSKKEDQKQFIIQGVAEYRKLYADAKKSTLMK